LPGQVKVGPIIVTPVPTNVLANKAAVLSALTVIWAREEKENTHKTTQSSATVADDFILRRVFIEVIINNLTVKRR